MRGVVFGLVADPVDLIVIIDGGRFGRMCRVAGIRIGVVTDGCRRGTRVGVGGIGCVPGGTRPFAPSKPWVHSNLPSLGLLSAHDCPTRLFGVGGMFIPPFSQVGPQSVTVASLLSWDGGGKAVLGFHFCCGVAFSRMAGTRVWACPGWPFFFLLSDSTVLVGYFLYRVDQVIVLHWLARWWSTGLRHEDSLDDSRITCRVQVAESLATLLSIRRSVVGLFPGGSVGSLTRMPVFLFLSGVLVDNCPFQSPGGEGSYPVRTLWVACLDGRTTKPKLALTGRYGWRLRVGMSLWVHYSARVKPLSWFVVVLGLRAAEGILRESRWSSNPIWCSCLY